MREGTLSMRVLDFLRRYGPTTAVGIADGIGEPHLRIRYVCNSLAKRQQIRMVGRLAVRRSGGPGRHPTLWAVWEGEA